MKKISIIVPVFNDGNYIQECIESLIKQTYQNIEIILVNDGSTDNSLQICFKYLNKDPRITLISQNNAGVSAARNNGLSHVTGDYICFVDGDDFVSPDYCQNLLTTAQQRKADIAINTYQLFQNGKYFVILKPNPSDHSLDGSYNSLEWVRIINDKLDIILKVSVCGKLFKRSLFDTIRFPIGVKIAEDAAVLPLLYLKANQIAFVNKPTYIYRKHGKTAISSYNPLNIQKHIDENQVALRLASKIECNNLIHEYLQYLKSSTDKESSLFKKIIQHYHK